MEAITKTDLPLKLHSKGKVRDTYEYKENLLMIATDRLSAFDVVFNEGIPYKGIVLTELSLFWFEKLKGIVDNHLISPEIPPDMPEYLNRRAMVVKKANPFPIECVVRGYLAGSGLKEYTGNGTVCGIELPPGLQNGSKLPQPIFTPATKAEQGEHDINIDDIKGAEMIGDKAIYERLKELSLEIYKFASDYARGKGIILADTKFEFGLYNGNIILIDEVLTPDSSRYWPAESYDEGNNQISFDKQYVRDYLETLDWNKSPPPPKLPDGVVENTTKKYIEAYERLTGNEFKR